MEIVVVVCWEGGSLWRPDWSEVFALTEPRGLSRILSEAVLHLSHKCSDFKGLLPSFVYSGETHVLDHPHDLTLHLKHGVSLIYL